MRSLLHTPFTAVLRNEILLGSKRIAPYALIILFSANAVLWWGWGPAVERGWATNSDFYIHRNFGGFSFILGLPIFTAVIMGDSVIRDFRLGIDSLIFSKPVSRAAYLLGKFFGNFFVLVCCQSAFALTLLFLQFFHPSRMIVLPFRLVPYFKHFFLVVVISHVVLAAFYFTVGTLTRNAKIVWALAASFYPLYIAYQKVLLQNLPQPWRLLLDPLGFNPDQGLDPWHRSANYLNDYVVSYGSDMIANRVLIILVTAACLTILYFRFAIAERTGKAENFSVLNLSTAAERVYYDRETVPPSSHREALPAMIAQYETPEVHEKVTLPSVTRASDGVRANLSKLIAALVVEFRLLRAERSLVVIVPLAVFISILDLAFWKVAPVVSYSATYAGSTATTMLPFLIGMTVFYTSEAMHRDRETMIEPLLWSAPVANPVMWLSKFLATLLLTLSLVVSVGLMAIVIQLIKGDTPVEIPAYLIVYSVVLLPSIVFMAAAATALNVLLRDKYLTYAVSIVTASGLFYLYNQGYNHWLYNPLLFRLWSYVDLTSGRILTYRIYCLALTGLCLAVAHLCFQRGSGRGSLREGSSRISSK